MRSNSLNELSIWARGQIGNPILLSYQLYKVNAQISGKLFLLLRAPESLRVNAEIEIEYLPNQDTPYHAVFSFLPFNLNYPRPVQLRPTFSTQQDVMHWIKTGQKRI